MPLLCTRSKVTYHCDDDANKLLRAIRSSEGCQNAQSPSHSQLGQDSQRSDK